MAMGPLGFMNEIIRLGKLTEVESILPCLCLVLNQGAWGSWMAQLVEHWTSAQAMISQFVSLSPTSGCVLTVQSLLRILCPPLSLPLPHLGSVCISLKSKYTFKKVKKGHLGGSVG